MEIVKWGSDDYPTGVKSSLKSPWKPFKESLLLKKLFFKI
jgi:hypothetical protein